MSTGNRGRAVAHVVSRWLSTAAAWDRAQVRSCGISGGQSCTGEGFLRVLRFLLSIIPPTAPYSSSIIQGWYNRPNNDSLTEWTQSHPTPKTKKGLIFETHIVMMLKQGTEIARYYLRALNYFYCRGLDTVKCYLNMSLATNDQSKLLSTELVTTTPWTESASELYRPSDRRLSTKL
jgi:hypothetical protein